MALATGGSLTGGGAAWSGNIAREAQPVPALVSCVEVPVTGAWALWFQVAENRLAAGVGVEELAAGDERAADVGAS